MNRLPFSMSSPNRDPEINVVSSPESSSRNGSPEPDTYRLINHNQHNSYPVIKTSDDDERTDKDAKAKSVGGSTNFSISSILSRADPTVKKNGFMGVQGGGVMETGIGGAADSGVLSR
ncbi:unnamed protein product [Psylliodes chrysocephalus]|uniref:Uncharacterized protein n=1 Tax=Psylliodes chrysocephalus TaxID=3402493 RepID=A0A9P0G7U9_9CUCU|nr:unnamed protein product [Psylliodes chrysocephala]